MSALRFLLVLSVMLASGGMGTPKDSHAADDARQIPLSQQQMTLSFAPLVKKVAPAVVNIYTKRVVTTTLSPFARDPFFGALMQRNFGFGIPQQRVENSLGSGVIVESSGLVVTNAHVIKEAQEITVMLRDGREFPAKVQLSDDASDLALLRLDADGEKLPFAALQASDALEVGDLVLAIGNPFGVGQTVTSGIVSALARSSLDINDFNFFIQTDAAINPGNSGGPLVSMKGEVVGINTAIFSQSGGSLGIGFAVPSEMVATIIAAEKSGQVSRQGGIIRPWTGIHAQDLTSDVAQNLFAGKHPVSGALVTSLHPSSPAAQAGLKTGDVITAINRHLVQDSGALRFRLAMIPLGETITIDYQRQSEALSLQIKAISPPDQPARDVRVLKGKTPLSGAKIANLNPAVAAEMGLRENGATRSDESVIVVDVATDSIAARFVQPGDIILAINNKKIKTTSDIAAILDHPAAAWSITINSNGQKRTIIIR